MILCMNIFPNYMLKELVLELVNGQYFGMISRFVIK